MAIWSRKISCPGRCCCDSLQHDRAGVAG